MKYISKKRLIEIISQYDKDTPIQFIEDDLYYACQEINPWIPIDKTPEEGNFLVYMPEEHMRKFQVAYFHKNVSIIGSNFAFDLSKPTHYCELPKEPE